MPTLDRYTQLLIAADTFADYGLAAYPADPARKGDKDSGKSVRWKWRGTDPMSSAELTQRMGNESNLWVRVDWPWAVLDLDSQDLIDYWRDKLGPVWDKAARVRTGSGLHVWFRLGEGATVAHRDGSKKPPKTETLRAEGKGGVIVPPSRHWSGRIYRWEDDRGLDWATPLTVDEAKLLDRPRKKGGKKAEREGRLAGPGPDWAEQELTDELEFIRQAPERNNAVNTALIRLGHLVGGGVLDLQRVLSEVETVAREVGLEDEEIAKLLRGADQDGPLYIGMREPKSDPPEDLDARGFHDVANGRRLVRDFGERLRFNPAVGWLVWDGNRWERDTLGMVKEFAKKTAREILTEARDEPDEDKAKKLAAWSTNSLMAGRVNAMIQMAQTNPSVAVRLEALDADPWKLPVGNGAVDLRTGELLEANPRWLFTRGSTVVYDPKATAPEWEGFIDWMTCGDADLARYLQLAVGASLTGLQLEEIFFLYGPTSGNGKGTLTTALEHVAGNYAHSAQSSLLEPRMTGSGHQEDLARTFGARVIIVPETRPGRRWDTSLVKQIAGGDVLSVSEKGKPQFSFRPHAKIWVSGNHKPDLGAYDPAMFRRMRVIPCRATLDPTKMDYGFKDRMAHAEGAGILNWAVAGCLAWRQADQRLAIPESVRRASAKYQAEEDKYSTLLDRLAFEPNARCPGSILAGLLDDPEAAGLTLMELQREIIRRGDMVDVDVTKRRTKRGVEWLGVRMKSATESRESTTQLRGVTNRYTDSDGEGVGV